MPVQNISDSVLEELGKTVEELTEELQLVKKSNDDLSKANETLDKQSRGANASMSETQKELEEIKKKLLEAEKVSNSKLSESELLANKIEELTELQKTMQDNLKSKELENTKLKFRNELTVMFKAIADEKRVSFDLVDHMVVDEGDIESLKEKFIKECEKKAKIISDSVNSEIIARSGGATPIQDSNVIKKSSSLEQKIKDAQEQLRQEKRNNRNQN